MKIDPKPLLDVVISCPQASPVRASDQHPTLTPQPKVSAKQCHIILLLIIIAVGILFYIFISCPDCQAVNFAPEFSLISATISSFNLSSPAQNVALLSYEFEVALSVHNPNINSISSGGVSVVLIYLPNSQIIDVALPHFYLTGGNSTIIRGKMVVVEEYMESGVARRMAGERAISWAIGVDVKIIAQFKVLHLDHVHVTACKDVRIVFKNETTTEGSLEGAPKMCDFYDQYYLKSNPQKVGH